MSTMETRKNRNGINIKIRFSINKQRRRLCLGSKYTLKQAEKIRQFVDELANARETGGQISRSASGFISEMTADLRQRFVACGLLDPPSCKTIRELWDRFLSEPSDRKDSTLTTYVTCRKRFFAFFNTDTDPCQITKKDGEEWKLFLVKHGYAEASVAGSIQRANSVLNWAVEQEIIPSNPFRGIRRGSFSNPGRQFYVPMEWYEKLLDACPDQCWRTLLALCRIGGLRNPSETLLLTWQDVNFTDRSVLVHSPKTEHHPGKATQLIPMFPRLRQELERQRKVSPQSSFYVIDKWRDTASNMRTHFQRIIFRAGLPEWPRLFQNLRESRANELWSDYPEHVAEIWMGHSKPIATRHYLQVTEAQFQKALGPEPAETEQGTYPEKDLEPKDQFRGHKWGQKLRKTIEKWVKLWIPKKQRRTLKTRHIA